MYDPACFPHFDLTDLSEDLVKTISNKHKLVQKEIQLYKTDNYILHEYRKMYIGHARLCVCPSPHSHTTARIRI